MFTGYLKSLAMNLVLGAWFAKSKYFTSLYLLLTLSISAANLIFTVVIAISKYYPTTKILNHST